MMQQSSKILWNTEASPNYYKIAFPYPENYPAIGSGQFFMVRVAEGSDPLLRRALAVYRVGGVDVFPELKGPGLSAVEFLYRAVGRGTGFLAKKREGDSLDWVGPLGNSYTLPKEGAHHYLVAGGTGLSSLYVLAKELIKIFPVSSVHLMVGGRSQKDILCLPDFEPLGIQISVTTEDGTKGARGRVTDVLESALRTVPSDSAHVYTAGPIPMMAKVASISKERKIACQVSLEGPMGCGFGICLGCSVEIFEKGERKYRLLCKHGPIFNSEEVYWGEA
ncbi:MAG: dihydroorotate dehydrogenase electron transfer subunit [Deltaproteobacteria bacterium]|nr:dihydroorotate dehydrogenase electron transfer subunit [Deltaproteobacteria bacterium]